MAGAASTDWQDVDGNYIDFKNDGTVNICHDAECNITSEGLWEVDSDGIHTIRALYNYPDGRHEITITAIKKGEKLEGKIVDEFHNDYNCNNWSATSITSKLNNLMYIGIDNYCNKYYLPADSIEYDYQQEKNIRFNIEVHLDKSFAPKCKNAVENNIFLAVALRFDDSVFINKNGAYVIGYESNGRPIKRRINKLIMRCVWNFDVTKIIDASFYHNSSDIMSAPSLFNRSLTSEQINLMLSKTHAYGLWMRYQKNLLLRYAESDNINNKNDYRHLKESIEGMYGYKDSSYNYCENDSIFKQEKLRVNNFE